MASNSTSPADDSAFSEQREIIAPPTNLKHFARKTQGDNKLDLSVLVKAEAALKKISSQYGDWMKKEIDALRSLRAEIQQNGMSKETSEKLFFLMHNLKDCGATFGYPYVATVAASLCEAIEQVTFNELPAEIVDNHLNAVFAIVNENATGDTNFVAGTLASRLTEVTREYLHHLQK